MLYPRCALLCLHPADHGDDDCTKAHAYAYVVPTCTKWLLPHRHCCAPSLLCTVTAVHRHCCAPSLLCTITTVHHHYCAPSLLCTVTAVHCHYCAQSLLCTVTAVHCHCCAPSLLCSKLYAHGKGCLDNASPPFAGQAFPTPRTKPPLPQPHSTFLGLDISVEKLESSYTPAKKAG